MTKLEPLVIAGAGPAGATASAFLCKERIPHILLDKAVFPRDKVCGDAMSGKVLSVLRKLDPDLTASIFSDSGSFLGSSGIRFAAPDGNFIDIPFGSNPEKLGHPPGFVSRRMVFDAFLTKQVNPQYADFRQGHELMRAERKEDGWLLAVKSDGGTYEIRCNLAIGAEGDRSILAKTAGLKKVEPEHYCAGIRAYYENVEGLHPKNYIELHFIRDLLPGYLWIFPLPGGRANVGAGMLSASVSRKRVNLREAMLHALENHPTLKHRFANARMEGSVEGWGLPLGSQRRVISADHLLLAGDAASMIDPFTGEGISNAMYCGMQAAEMAKQALNSGTFTASYLSRYDAVIYQRLWSELKLSHTLQKLCNYPWLFNFVVNRARKNPTLRETISCMFDDLDLRARFKSPSFYVSLLFNRSKNRLT